MCGEKLKWRQLAHHQLMSQQEPHFSPHSKAKEGKLVTRFSKLGEIHTEEVDYDNYYYY